MRFSASTRSAAGALFSLWVLLCVPCCHPPSPESGTRVVVDEVGREVHLPARIDRVAAVRPGALRLLLYIDGADRVAAVESMEKRKRSKPYLMAYPELAGRPSLGPPHGGDAELIAALELNVVFSTRLSPQEAERWQERTGVPFVVLGYGDLGQNRARLQRSLRIIGQVLDRGERAEQLIGFFDEISLDLARRTVGISPSRRAEAYVAGVAYRGAHGIVSTEPRYEPFEMVGVRNTAREVGDAHAFVDRERIVLWNPAYIFVDRASTAMVVRDLRRPEFTTLRAVATSAVHGLFPYNWYWINFGTVLANAYAVGHVVYPRQFEDVDPAARARAIYAELLGRDVYNEMQERYGGYDAIEMR